MKKKGSAAKPIETSDIKDVEYSSHHWSILNEKRVKAKKVMELLQKYNIKTLLYGSVCRGDVSEKSDIDLFVPFTISSFQIESALLQEKQDIYEKRIIQATPKHLVKAHIYLDEQTCITFPLTTIRNREFDFIQFGGSLSFEDLLQEKRVPGVDKRLILIEPTNKGHRESPVKGFESVVAQKIGVDVELVKERVRILTTRDRKGRTGVYLNVELAIDENIEEVFKQLMDKDPIIRRRSKY